MKLGIEALKHMKSERTIYGFKRHFPLRGETLEASKRPHFHQPTWADIDKRGT